MYVLVRWAYHEVCLYFSVTLTITFHIFIQSVNTCLAIVLFMEAIEALWHEHRVLGLLWKGDVSKISMGLN